MKRDYVPIVALVGRTNVGKSSLFNALIGRREAITAAEVGTTRDSVTAKASWEGSDFWLVDTAGLKVAEDDFELTIQEQIRETADTADLIVVLVEADIPITAEDRQIANLALKSQKPVVLAVNKIDKHRSAQLSQWQRLGIKQAIATSATQKSGIEELLDAVSQSLPKANIEESGDKIVLSLVGRPNVGKSSLFNALAKKQQAIVSAQSGTTRDINRVTVRYKGRDVELADTAGIRRSGKIQVGVEKFSVIRALSAISESDISLLLVDVSEVNFQLDQKIAGLVKEAGRGLIIVVSKWDTVENKEDYFQTVSRQIAANFVFVPWAPLIFTSSVTGQNTSRIFDLVMEIDQARRLKIKTPQLNQWLKRTTQEKTPVGLKNKLPKLNYIVQENEVDFPSFKIFGSHTRFLHWSYKRYLERKFRETWSLSGTPLKFWFIEKTKE